MASELADIKAVRENWTELLHDDITALGCNVFRELFKLNPTYIDKFGGIRERGEVTTSNPKLREHAVRVMSEFDAWMHALNDAPVLEGLLLRQGREHVGRKVFEKEFMTMKKAIEIAMSNGLGAKFNAAAFDRVYKKIVDTLNRGQR